MKLMLLSRLTGMSALAGAALIAGAAACSEPAPPPAPPPPPAPVAKTAEARVQWYQDCWGLFNDKAWDKFQACYDDNVISETVDSAQPAVNGAANVIARDKAEAASFPDRRGEVRVVLGNGEKLVGVALYTATNTGALPPGPDGKPGPATGKPVGFLFAHSIDLDPTGSKAIREAAYIEEGTMMAQLGLNPNPARKAEKPSGAPTMVVIAKNDATEAANLAAAQAIFDAFNLHDVKAMDAMTPADYKAIEIARPKDLGKKESMAALKEMFNAFPDVRLTIATKWAAGDFVVVTGSLDGTNTGDMPSMGMKKTGKKVTSRFLEILRFEGGKVKEDWLFYNSAAWAAQLGIK